MKGKLEAKERELRELIKEISKYDDTFHSGKPFVTLLIELGSVLNENSMLHNESVLNELSTLEHLREGHGRTFVQGGDDAMAFEERTESMNNDGGRQRKTYSKSMIKH